MDANILFSASLKATSPFRSFWASRRVEPVTSLYAIGETNRNVRSLAQRESLDLLLSKTQIVSDADVRVVPGHVRLAEKDQPILAAAIAASVDYLVTGDANHFGTLFDRTVVHVRIVNPATFLKLIKE